MAAQQLAMGPVMYALPGDLPPPCEQLNDPAIKEEEATVPPPVK